jgi:hypothetical protein
MMNRRERIDLDAKSRPISEPVSTEVWACMMAELRALWAVLDASTRQRDGGFLPLCGDLLGALDAYHAGQEGE